MGDKKNAEDLVCRAKAAAHDGDFQESIQLFQMAYDIHPSDKIKRRMEKLKLFMEESEEDEDEMVELGNKFFLHKSIANNLYEYQKEGVLWFWKLFKRNAGGILGDDMGLGKTIQVIAFLSGMYDAARIKTVIIVAPLAVLINWENEFRKWAGGLRIKTFHGTKVKERISNLRKIQSSKGVLLTTYGMVLPNIKSLCVDENGDKFIWDYIILDEGHKIKNATKTSKYIRCVNAKFHYVLTGTPIQNNLGELWSLFDFTQEGQLLGTKKTFDIEFQKPIVRAREKDANAYSQQIGNMMSERLRDIIAPYFLRRTKDEVFKKKDEVGVIPHENSDKNGNSIVCKEEVDNTPNFQSFKNDLVIWVYLSPLQLLFYEGMAKSERVKQTLLTKRSPLAELNCLKKICDHPRLQSTLSKLLTSTEEQDARLDSNTEEIENIDSEPHVVEAAHAAPVENLIADSGKMVFLVCLMENLRKENHRTIIFSQSRKMLDIIQKVLLSLKYKLLRIDGTITNPQDREKVIARFHSDYSYNVLLMTIQVGSVGLNLTTADRVIIFDPSWNPGTDAQAVDRIYRLGQRRNVIVYRLITCGSIEEKIYRKQIFKNAIMKQTTGSSNNPYRYFTNLELRELFLLDDPQSSATQIQLQEMHPPVNTVDDSFKQHLAFLNNKQCIFGVSHHDQLFTEEATNDDTDCFENEVESQVLHATQKMDKECSIAAHSEKMTYNHLLNKDPSPKPLQEFKRNERSNPGIDVSPLELLTLEEEKPFRASEINDPSAASHYDSIIEIKDKSELNGEENDNHFLIKEEKDQMSEVNASFANFKMCDDAEKHIKGNRDPDCSRYSIYCGSVISSCEDVNQSKVVSLAGTSLEESIRYGVSRVEDTDLDDSSYVMKSKYAPAATSGLSKIISDSFDNIETQNHDSKEVFTPKLVRDLGKNYRTPPWSPLYNKTSKKWSEDDGVQGRGASTPVSGDFCNSSPSEYLSSISYLALNNNNVPDQNSVPTSQTYIESSVPEKCHDIASSPMIIDDQIKSIDLMNPIINNTNIKVKTTKSFLSDEQYCNSMQDINGKCESSQNYLSETKSYYSVEDVACSPITNPFNYDDTNFHIPVSLGVTNKLPECISETEKKHIVCSHISGAKSMGKSNEQIYSDIEFADSISVNNYNEEKYLSDQFADTLPVEVSNEERYPDIQFSDEKSVKISNEEKYLADQFADTLPVEVSNEKRYPDIQFADEKSVKMSNEEKYLADQFADTLPVEVSNEKRYPDIQLADAISVKHSNEEKYHADQFADTVAVEVSKEERYTDVQFADTIPVVNDEKHSGNQSSDILPINTNSIIKNRELNMRYDHGGKTLDQCKSNRTILRHSQIISDESEDCYFDFGLLESIRNKSVSAIDVVNLKVNIETFTCAHIERQRDETCSPSDIKKNNLKHLDINDSNISKNFEKNMEEIDNLFAPDRHASSLSRNDKLQSLKKIHGDECCAEEVKLQQLKSLLQVNMDTNFIDDHLFIQMGGMINDLDMLKL